MHLAAPDRLLWVVVGAVIVWGVWAFGSEMMLNLRLNQQVATLRAQNAQLAASNEQARMRVQTAASGAAMEEAARNQGFTRPGEQVYVIVKPSAGPSPAATAAAAVPVRRQDSGGVLETISRWWRNLWH